jgi:hypothetical protein
MRSTIEIAGLSEFFGNSPAPRQSDPGNEKDLAQKIAFKEFANEHPISVGPYAVPTGKSLASGGYE